MSRFQTHKVLPVFNNPRLINLFSTEELRIHLADRCACFRYASSRR